VFRPFPAVHLTAWGKDKMMMWPLVTLIGFLVLTALVIAMGTRSTARYEAERAEVASGHRQAAGEPVRATATA
jgi:hypothetical protein